MGQWEASLDRWLTTPPEPDYFCPECGSGEVAVTRRHSRTEGSYWQGNCIECGWTGPEDDLKRDWQLREDALWEQADIAYDLRGF